MNKNFNISFTLNQALVTLIAFVTGSLGGLFVGNDRGGQAKAEELATNYSALIAKANEEFKTAQQNLNKIYVNQTLAKVQELYPVYDGAGASFDDLFDAVRVALKVSNKPLAPKEEVVKKEEVEEEEVVKTEEVKEKAEESE